LARRFRVLNGHTGSGWGGEPVTYTRSPWACRWTGTPTPSYPRAYHPHPDAASRACHDRPRPRTLTPMHIRPATTRAARAIARVQLRGWQTGYRGIVPDAYLATL